MEKQMTSNNTTCSMCKTAIPADIAEKHNGMYLLCAEKKFSTMDITKIVIISIFFGIFFGILLGIVVGELLVKIFKIPSFEGEAGYFVVFLVIPTSILISGTLSAMIIHKIMLKKKRKEQERSTWI